MTNKNRKKGAGAFLEAPMIDGDEFMHMIAKMLAMDTDRMMMEGSKCDRKITFEEYKRTYVGMLSDNDKNMFAEAGIDLGKCNEQCKKE